MSFKDCPQDVALSRAVSNGADPGLLAHFATCTRCESKWRQLTDLQRRLRELPPLIPDAERRAAMLDRLQVAIANQDVPTERGGWGRPRVWLAAGGLAVTLYALVMIGLLGRWRDESARSGRWRATVHPIGTASFAHGRSAHDEVIRLTNGTIVVDVDPLLPGERCRVQTGDGEVEVRGTSFSVAAARDCLTGVVVSHGRVEVHPRLGGPVVLGAGDHWQAPPRSSTGPAASPGTPSPRQTAPTQEGGPELPPPDVEAPAVSPSSEEGMRRPPPQTSGHARQHAPPLRGAGALPALPGGAIEHHFADGWAALGRGQYLQAASAFQSSVRAAPSEPIAEDALYWQGVALARGGERADSIRILSDFVRVHRGSPRCGEASSILGWQLLQAGRAEEAEPHLRRALQDPRREIRETAQAGLSALAHAPGGLDGSVR